MQGAVAGEERGVRRDREDRQQHRDGHDGRNVAQPDRVGDEKAEPRREANISPISTPSSVSEKPSRVPDITSGRSLAARCVAAVWTGVSRSTLECADRPASSAGSRSW